IYETLLADEPQDQELKDGLADVHYNLGIWLMSRRGIRTAEPSFRRSIEIVEQRAIESPMQPNLLDSVAGQRLQLAAWMERGGMKKEAEREKRNVFDLFARATTPASASGPADNEETRADWAALAYRSLARQMERHHWTREQEQALRLGLRFRPKHPDLLYELASLLAFRSGADREAVYEAAELAQQAAETGPANPDYWRVLALARLHEGNWQS